jgi:hypothetical protein
MVRSGPVTRTRLLASALALLACLAAAPARAEQAKPAQAPAPSSQGNAWWTQRLSYGAGPMVIENLWSKGPRMRAESVFLGHPIVTLVDEQRYVMFDEVTRTGVAIARSPASIALDAKRKRPFGDEADELIADGGEKVGTEVRAGEEVEHYRLTEPGGNQREVWASADGFRLPSESRRFDRATGQESRIIYVRWLQHGFPDDFFRPAPDVKLEQLSYEEYVARSAKEAVGPAPPLYAYLLHGPRPK